MSTIVVPNAQLIGHNLERYQAMANYGLITDSSS